VARIIRDARTKLTAGVDQDPSEVQETDFSELSGTLVIAKGTIKNDDLALKSPLLRVTGKGTVDLPREQVDYLITAAIVGTLKGQHGPGVEELRDVPVPIRIRGTFDDISYTPDLEVLAKRLLQEKGAQELKKRLEEDVRERLRDIPFLGGAEKGEPEQEGTGVKTPSIRELFKR
jgi:AsmA protein